MVNPLVCRKETFLEIVNSVPNATNRLFKDLEKFFENTVVDVKILLDICILVFILFVFFVLVEAFTRNASSEKQSDSSVESPSSREDEESVDDGTTEEEEKEEEKSVVNNAVEDGVTLEVEENKRKKVPVVKRKSVSAAPNLHSYRLKHAKPKPKLLTNFDILQYMFVFLF